MSIIEIKSVKVVMWAICFKDGSTYQVTVFEK